MTTPSEWAKLEWMGRHCRVWFKPHWPIKFANYVYDGFDEQGVWVTHETKGQRHILWHDIERITT
jgi:hypothetical protein